MTNSTPPRSSLSSSSSSSLSLSSSSPSSHPPRASSLSSLTIHHCPIDDCKHNETTNLDMCFHIINIHNHKHPRISSSNLTAYPDLHPYTCPICNNLYKSMANHLKNTTCFPPFKPKPIVKPR